MNFSHRVKFNLAKWTGKVAKQPRVLKEEEKVKVVKEVMKQEKTKEDADKKLLKRKIEIESLATVETDEEKLAELDKEYQEIERKMENA